MALSMIASLLFVAPLFCHGLDGWEKYALVWEDNFDGSVIDPLKWQHEITAAGGGNDEFQLYTQEETNSFVRDGMLFIKPTLLADTRKPQTDEPYGEEFMTNGVLNVTALYGKCTNDFNEGCHRTGAAGNIPPTMSARLRTFERFSFKFGRVEISAKMPVGDWLWPAIWLLPEHWVYGEWPRSGEIDLSEGISNRDLVQNGQKIGIDRMGVSMHWGPSWDDNHYYLTNQHTTNANNYGDHFHKYILDWSPNGVRIYIDDEAQALMEVPFPQIDQNPDWINMWEYGKPWKTDVNPWTSGSNLAPFDESFHFILHVAVGGLSGHFPDTAVNHGGDANHVKPWSNGDMYVPALKKFYDARANWKSVWDIEGENSAMQVDYIRVYQGE